MKIMFASDLHLGKKSWASFGEDVLRKCIEGPPVDVFLFGGDLVEPHVDGVRLEDGLKLIQRIPADLKLWVAGNNDIEHLVGNVDNVLENYASVLHERAQKFGVLLLDHRPVTFGDTTFVGNYAACDLSLWRPSKIPVARFPNTIEDLRKQANASFQRHIKCSVEEMFQFCQGRLKSDIQNASYAKKLVVATHVSPTPEFVFYEHSAEFDHKNAFMGWDDNKTEVPIHAARSLVLQVCGHTHRRETLERPQLVNRAPLLNISGDNQPRIVDI